MRSRNIKPGFFKNDKLAEVDPLGRLLFIGLWSIGDRDGKLKDRPRRIAAEVLPYDVVDVDGLLDDLHRLGFIERYEVGGEQYILVTNFKKHQNPHVNEKPGGYPDPLRAEYGTSTVQVPDKHGANPSDSCSLIPDLLNPEEESDISSSSSPLFAEKEDPWELADTLRESILQNNAGAKVPDPSSKQFQKWCLTFDRMIRLDQRKPGEVAAMIHFSQADDFWMTNILSPDSLRRQYDKLFLQAQKAGAKMHIGRSDS